MSEWRSLVWLTAHEPEPHRDPFADVPGPYPGPRTPRQLKGHPDCSYCLWAESGICGRHRYRVLRSVA